MDISKIDPAELPYIAAGDPPDGVTSNLSNPPTRVGETVIVICVTVPIMAVALALRLYTRLRVTRNFGADDCRCRSIVKYSFRLLHF